MAAGLLIGPLAGEEDGDVDLWTKVTGESGSATFGR